MTLHIDFNPVSELETIPSFGKRRARGFGLIYPANKLTALACNFAVRNDYHEPISDLQINFETGNNSKLFTADVKIGYELKAGDSLNFRKQLTHNHRDVSGLLPDRQFAEIVEGLTIANLWESPKTIDDPKLYQDWIFVLRYNLAKKLGTKTVMIKADFKQKFSELTQL